MASQAVSLPHAKVVTAYETILQVGSRQMTQVVEINAIEHLESIRLRWTSLFYETRGGSFFHTFDWLQLYWRQFRDHQRLKVLLVHRAGTVLGILPLVVRGEATAAGITTTLTYPTISPHHPLGPIGSNPTATLMASLRYLANDSPDWEVLSLPSIGEHDCGRTQNAMQLAELSIDACSEKPVSKILFDDSSRGDLPNAKLGSTDSGSTNEGLTFSRVRSFERNYEADDSICGIADSCFDLLKCLPMELDIRQPRHFFREMVMTAHRLGMLDLNLLSEGERLSEFSFNVHRNGVIRQICVNDSDSNLTSQMLQDCSLREDKCFYFAGSPNPNTHLGATERSPVVCYEHHAAPSFQTRIVRIRQWLRSP